MSLRVAQQMIYQSSVDRMNVSLAQIMESNLQAATQKKINRPSDDPAGMAPALLVFDGELKAEGVNPCTSADLTVASLLAAELLALGGARRIP